MSRSALAFLVAVLAFAHPAQAFAEEEAPPAAEAEAAPAKQEGPTTCTFGIYVLSTSSVDMKESSFGVDMYLWQTFRAESDDACEFEIQNAESEDRKISYKETKDGLHYVVYRIKAKVKAQFLLAKYPFDVQLLPLFLESPGHAEREVIFEPEKLPAGFKLLDTQVGVPGWDLSRIDFFRSTHHYDTRFGYPFGAENEQDYSRVSFIMTARRLSWPYFLRAFLPLLIVVGCSCLVFLLTPDKIDTALATSITSLLAAIALHLVEAGALPSIGYLVALDKVFILSYGVILVVALEKVVSYRLMLAGKDALARRIDRGAVFAIPGLYLIAQGVLLVASS